MRIALVTETFPPEINGVAMTMGRLVAGLSARGQSVQIIHPRQPGVEPPPADGLEFFRVPGLPMPRYRGLRFGLPCGRRLRRLWSHTRPDVVHVATEGPLGVSARRAAERLKLPVSSSFHTNFHQYGRHYGLAVLARPVLAHLRRFHNRCACTLVPSRDLLNELADAGFENLGILSRGVDTALFNPEKRSDTLRASWSAGPDDPVAIYAGRIAHEKNIPLVFQAFDALRALSPRARLVLVGDGPAAPAFKRLRPDVVFTGRLPAEAMAACYASGDLFLFASTTETFGNVVLEAMASGLAVLTYDYVAGRTYIKQGQNGLLAPLGNSQAFIDAARRLATDGDLRARLGPAARQTALTITWDAVIDSFLDRLRRVAQGESPGLQGAVPSSVAEHP